MNDVELENLYKRCNNKQVRRLSVDNGEVRFNFEAKHRLSVWDAAKIVADVCNGVVDSEAGFYYPELRDYCLRVAVLKTYTNLALPSEKAGCWDLVYGTPIFAMVTGHDKRPVTFDGREYDDNMVIDVEQYEQILKAIDQKIDYALMRNYAGGKPNDSH